MKKMNLILLHLINMGKQCKRPNVFVLLYSFSDFFYCHH